MRVLPPTTGFLGGLGSGGLGSLCGRTVRVVYRSCSVNRRGANSLTKVCNCSVCCGGAGCRLTCQIERLSSLVVVIVVTKAERGFCRRLGHCVHAVWRCVFMSRSGPPRIGRCFRKVVLLAGFVPTLPCRVSSVFPVPR